MKEDKDLEGREGRAQERSAWRQLAKYGQLGVLLPSCTVAGWLIGSVLDRWAGTSWMTVAGLILGTVAGFVELLRILLRAEKEK